MKSAKGLIGLLAFAICLWAVVVVTYASQAKSGAATGPGGVPFPQQSTDCSSTSSSHGE